MNCDDSLAQSERLEKEFDDLVDKVIGLICKHASDATFDENNRIVLAKLIKYLKFMKEEKFLTSRDYITTLGAILEGDKPNITILLELVQQIRIQYWSSRRTAWGWFVRRFGSSAAVSMGAGALLALVCFLVIALALYGFFPHEPGSAAKGEPLEFMDVNILAPLLQASALGALVSLFSRIDAYYSLTTYHPGVVFLNGFFKPFIAMALAVAVFALLKSGIVRVQGVDLDFEKGATAYYTLWVIGFLSGFSERLANDLVARAEGVFGKKP